MSTRTLMKTASVALCSSCHLPLGTGLSLRCRWLRGVNVGDRREWLSIHGGLLCVGRGRARFVGGERRARLAALGHLEVATATPNHLVLFR
jgi:hypothetical protein